MRILQNGPVTRTVENQDSGHVVNKRLTRKIFVRRFGRRPTHGAEVSVQCRTCVAARTQYRAATLCLENPLDALAVTVLLVDLGADAEDLAFQVLDIRLELPDREGVEQRLRGFGSSRLEIFVIHGMQLRSDLASVRASD